ncbi:hypothetical protein V502_01664 [Pseudogymnoascus sp. VKM F-4520 (FW-2644)]|nr:hypothetical protein V502_01664 [Pseudogymnoascus sp. VKM F-4520 (FW-2644)]
MPKFQKRKTPEEQWQYIYHHLFPDDDRTFSPYFGSSIDQSDREPEHREPEHREPESPTFDKFCDFAPLVATAPAIGSKVQPTLYEDIQRELAERALKEEKVSKRLDTEYIEGAEEDMRKSGMTHASPYHVPTYLNDLHRQEAKSSECGRYESQSSEPQAPVMENIIGRTHHNFLMDRYLEGHKTPPPRDSSPFRREMQSQAIPSLSAADDFGAEISPSNSGESPSGTSEQSTELCEEEEPQFSDFGGVDTRSITYLSFDPIKQALFDNSERQFWSFYNGLSVSDCFALWSKHATYTGAASSSMPTQRSTFTASGTRTPSVCPSNAASLLTSKRKKTDDEDETNSNRNPPKRSNRTPLLKEGLNLACPFHKHKPKEYNHGILRFRTCSTTPFDTICRLRSQPVSVEGWTTEMNKKVTKRKDETEPERWGRIYRELFGRTVTDLPSPYFEPYNLPAANGADLETILHREVPRIVSNRLREQINNMDIPDAARALFDPSGPYFQFDNLIGSAIIEVFATIRSARGTANNAAAPPTPQSSSADPSTTGGSSTAQSASWENTPIGTLQSSRGQLSGFEPSPSVAPKDTMHSGGTGGSSYSGHIHGQVSPPAAELVLHASETASNLSPPKPPGQLHIRGEYMPQGGHFDGSNAHGDSMDVYTEYMFEDLDLDGGFGYQPFPNVSSGPDGAPACS